MKKQEEWSYLKKKIKIWIKDNKVIDVFVFGSSARGKAIPGDIDLCILINKEREKEIIDLTHSLSQLSKSFHINYLTTEAFEKGNSLLKTLLEEGISVKHDKPLADIYGFATKALVHYSLNFDRSKRTRFHYALRGRRGEEGLLSKLKGEILGNGVMLVPVAKEDELNAFLKMWDVKFKIMKILI